MATARSVSLDFLQNHRFHVLDSNGFLNPSAPAVAGFHGAEFSIPGAAVGAYAPYAMGKAMMSRPMQSYLSNQLISPYKGTISEVSKRAMLNALLGQNLQTQAGQ